MERVSEEVLKARKEVWDYIITASPGRLMLILEVLRGMFGDSGK